MPPVDVGPPDAFAETLDGRLQGRAAPAARVLGVATATRGSEPDALRPGRGDWRLGGPEAPRRPKQSLDD